jgi:hypothetical protein
MPVGENLRRHPWLVLAGILAVGLIAIGIIGSRGVALRSIDSYAACTEAGYPVTDSYPPVCRYGKRNFVGPADTAPSAPAALETVDHMTLVDGDTRGPYPPRGQVLIDNQADWEAYWRLAHTGISPLPPMLPVDFSQYSVAAASLGTEQTNGYLLKVTNVTRGAAGSYVDLTESIPTFSCKVTPMITNRYLIVRTPKLTEPVHFRLTSQPRKCG